MKILAITSIRSDYDLMSELYRRLHADDAIELKLLVSGAHLAPSYGLSVTHIERDGFAILAKIESLIDSDSKASRLKTASLLLQNSIDVVNHYQPDLILYVGDREDAIMGALLAGYLEIPSIHFWGGDHAADGNIDNPIRHAAAKLSSLHMVALAQHKARLQAIGEPAQRIFTIGNMALDGLRRHQACSMAELKKACGLADNFSEYALVIFHPLPAERAHYADYFEAILTSLIEHNLGAFISAPNTDPGNKSAFSLFNKYKDYPQFYQYGNLPRTLFYSAYKQAKFIIGNSSSGIVEAASIPLPAINVGQRQRGRYAEHNVVFCDPNVASICAAIEQVTDYDFLQSIAAMQNPYGDGRSAEKAYELIKTLNFNDFITKPEDPLRE